LIKVEYEAATIEHSLQETMTELKDLGDLVALFMVRKVCKKKDLNPR
tara:strand:- start:77 stop:217 length:141 start_codon:yes stop_codon:yes gene_type:complete